MAISWYPGGVFKRSQVTFQQGRKIGKDVEWYKNGALKRDTPYQNGVPMADRWCGMKMEIKSVFYIGMVVSRLVTSLNGISTLANSR